MSKKKSRNKDLTEKAKKTEGRIKVLRALPYRGNMIYLMVIDGEIFTWNLIYKKELYFGYLVITPEKGKSKLTKKQINQSATLALQGGIATLDMKLGIKPTKEEKKLVKEFEKGRKLMN